MGRIFLQKTLSDPEFAGEKREKLLEGLGRIGEVVPEPLPEVTAADAEGAVASIAGGALYTDEFYAAAEDMRVVARWGVGFDKANVAGATREGVLITISPVHTDTVAEYAVAQWLATLKRVYTLHTMAHDGDFRLLKSYDVQGSTLGLYGFGRIGQEVAKRARTLLGPDGTLLVSDLRPDIAEVAARYDAEVVGSPAELFARSDTVSLHVSGADPIVDYALLSQMQPHASLINPSRANLVNDQDMARALDEGKLYYYVMDDPPKGLQEVHRGNPRVICTNHAAGITQESVERLDATCVGQVEAAIAGRRPDHILNPEALDHPRVRSWLRE